MNLIARTLGLLVMIWSTVWLFLADIWPQAAALLLCGIAITLLSFAKDDK